ncbi:MAG: hypothetical protein MUF48_04900 [Pirellulaceae bacterium]|jgi:hypothetical protein|nr:hypothetical protein [Pirellulaceae bacterium]
MEQLSFNTRKSLCNHLGELAGRELAAYLLELQTRCDRLERTKVDRMPVVPETPWSEWSGTLAD